MALTLIFLSFFCEMRMISWKHTLLILSFIVCFGVGVRAYGLGNNSFVADEFLDMNSAYGYFKTGEWRAWDFNRDEPSSMNANVARDERATIYKWQVAQLFRVLPPTETTARMVSVFWGCISIVVVFWSTLVFTKRRETALIAAALIALSVSGIIFDRRLRMYSMFAPVYLALATVLYLALERTIRIRWNRARILSRMIGLHIGYALLAGVLFVVGILTHQLTVTIILSTAVYLIWAGAQRYHATRIWKNRYFLFCMLGICGLVALRFLAPSFFASFSSGLIWLDNHYSYLGYVMTDYEHPLLAVLLMCFGAFHLITWERRSKAAWYLVFSFVVPLACAIWFFQRNAGPQYIFFAQSFGLILVASGIFGVWQSLGQRFVELGKRMALAVLFMLILLVPNFSYFFEENTTYHETASGGNPNYRKVFEYIKTHRQPTDVLVTRNFRNYYWSGADIFVYDLSDEVNRIRLSREALQRIVSNNESGWIVLSSNDYDYFSNDAEEYMKKYLERVSHSAVRGPIDVYRFEHVRGD